MITLMFRQTDNPILDSLAQLRIESLRAAAVLMIVVGWLSLSWALWPVSPTELHRVQMRPLCLFLMGIGALGFYLSERRVLLSSLLLVGGMFLAVLGGVGILESGDMVQLFAIPIIFSSVLLGRRAIISLTLLAVGFDLLVAPGWTDLSRHVFMTPAFVLIAVASAMIIATRNLYTAIAWALSGFETARQNQDIARERKAELEQALKSLDVSIHTVQRATYALEHAQKRAEEARRLKQQFAQTISHELRTPLNLIVGFTEAMIQSPEYYGEPLPRRYLRDLSIVFRNANHLQSLVNDVLDLARIEAAQMALQLERVALEPFLNEVKEMACSMVEKHQLTFAFEKDVDLTDLYMDPIRIKQVIYNLLSNAARFTDEGGITLRVLKGRQAVTFVVADTGIGIAAEDIPRIFEPFVQLENPMRRRIGGAGLGLSISRQLIDMHGSQLEVVSQPGKGSTFSFNLPTELPFHPAEKLAERSETILYQPEDDVALLVTHSPSAASLLSRHLNGYRTLVIRDIEGVNAAIDQVIPQVIIVDISDDSLTAQMISDLMRERQLWQTCLITCPLPGEAILRQRLAADSYLIKPISHHSLWDTLRQFGETIDRVLVVDDDPDFVRLLEQMLDTALQRYELSRAYSGHEALALIERRQPDLILLDLKMPDVNGFQVMERIRARPEWAGIRVVIVSAEDEIDMTNRLVGGLTIARPAGISANDVIGWLQGILQRSSS
jgi:signal transduction histidine kinase/DNA-binding response OmpR family regulator